jgi:hypothetical protein
MKIRELVLNLLAAAGILTFSPISAQAVTITTPQYLPTDTSFSVNINGGSGGQANMAFDLLGWASLDGVNYYEDDFTLSLNSHEIFKGSFSLGGAGGNSIFNNIFGLTVAGLQPDVVTWAGGDLLISGLINLAAGNNTLTFRYDALNIGHAGFQGTGDEAWGVNNLQVSTVPLPPAAIFMGTGLLALSRGRRKSQTK